MTIFAKIDNSNFKDMVIKNFFNCIDGYFFQRNIQKIESYQSFGDENFFCLFADDVDDGEPPFEGVKITFMDDEVIITTAELFEYVRLAQATKN